MGLDPLDRSTSVAMSRLRADCVETKEALSSETSVDIPVTLPGVNDEVLLRRTELEELVAPVLAPTVDALRRVVASAGLRPGQPDAVLLVGGSSRMPSVAREVSVALGRPVAVDAHPKHPVALGAALVAEARRPVRALARAPVATGPGSHCRRHRRPTGVWTRPRGWACRDRRSRCRPVRGSRRPDRRSTHRRG